MPWVQPWEGSPWSAASTASRFPTVGWKGSPVGRPSAARTVSEFPGLSSPAAVWWWWWSRPGSVGLAGAAGHPLQELDDRLRVRRECGGAGVVRTVIAFITDGGAVNS